MNDRTDRQAMRAGLKLKRFPASTDAAWNKAARTPWLELTDEQRDAGWPDAFTPENLARLQYPYEGIDPEKKRARKDQRALLDALRASIEADTLPTVERTRAVIQWRETPVQRDDFIGGDREVLVNVDAWKRNGGRVRITEDGTRIETFQAIERDTFRKFLTAHAIKPGEHIGAWFRGAKPAGRKSLTPDQQDREDLKKLCLDQWEKNPTQCITGKHGVVAAVGGSYVAKYSQATVEKWARAVAPETVRKNPGRPRNSPVAEK